MSFASPIVLILGANPDLQAVLTRLLRQLAPDAVIERQSANGLQADLIVMVDDAERETIATVRRLRQNEQNALLVVVGGESDSLLQHAFDAGAHEFIGSPLRENEVQARLGRLLKSISERKQANNAFGLLKQSVHEIADDRKISEADLLASFDRLAHFHDAVTGRHERRVSRYAALLARALRLSSDEVEMIERAAPLHDIGKIGIAESLLNKPGRLDDGEQTLMRAHSQMGYEILSNTRSPMLRAAASIARSHHERFDGQGYPQGLRQEQIPYEARLVALTDVYDALTSERPYKSAWSWAQVSGFITEHRGIYFDPEMVDVFLDNGDAVQALQTELSLADS